MKTRFFALAALLACAFLLTACPQQTTIGKLQSDPGRYRNKEVALVGRVTNSFGGFNFGAYELDDETGRVWVLTERGVPSKGARIGTVGKFVNGVTWGGRNYGSALQETDRRVR
jgi:hypothetical protein